MALSASNVACCFSGPRMLTVDHVARFWEKINSLLGAATVGGD